jgi:hypothetical protein
MKIIHGSTSSCIALDKQYKHQKFRNFLDSGICFEKHIDFGLPSKEPIATRYWSQVIPIVDHTHKDYPFRPVTFYHTVPIPIVHSPKALSMTVWLKTVDNMENKNPCSTHGEKYKNNTKEKKSPPIMCPCLGSFVIRLEKSIHYL